MSNDRDKLIDRALEEIANVSRDTFSNVSITKLPSYEGEFSNFPEELSKDVVNVFKERGIVKVYSHQKEAIKKVLNDKNIVVATPTASGKTLIYNSLSLNALSKNKSSKSLYLFPTKALAQDQLSELLELNNLLGDKIGLFTYDGDTPQSTRKAIRKQAQIVISNPYMLHSGILPHHTKWINLFENLEYIIIDELHSYTGVFGSHMANVIRRLKRICNFYGSNPKFIMSSATISNPKELAEMITSEKVELIDKSGAPRGEKYLVFFNPPVVNKQLGIRRSYLSVTRQVSNILLKNDLQIITFANTRLNTEILVKYLKNDFEKKVTDKGKIRGYRGGYLPKKRREIEQGLRKGNIKAVVSTNALELGIDIGSLDGAVLAGYPGSIASTWQRLGRAGRRDGKSIGVLVSSSSPINQFIFNHPEYFSQKSPETGRINPDNMTILIDHIKCAAYELPFIKGEHYGNEDLEEILKYLSDNNILFLKGNKWFWTTEGYPADAVSINRISSDNFIVIDRTGEEKVIAEVGFSSALETLHPKAIYILEGEQYIVEEMAYDNRKAFVKESDSDYYTDAVSHTKISVLDSFDSTQKNNYYYSYGDTHVYTQVVGFKKIKFFTNENIGAGDLQLPQQEMHTTSFWLTIKRELLDGIEISTEEKVEAVAGIAYLMRHIAAVFLMCDTNDIGYAVEDNITKSDIHINGIKKKVVKTDISPTNDLVEFEPNIYIYDNYPNGIGFSEMLYEKIEEILNQTIQVIETCECKDGCPSCIGPPIKRDSKTKLAAKFILNSLLGKIYN